MKTFAILMVVAVGAVWAGMAPPPKPRSVTLLVKAVDEARCKLTVAPVLTSQFSFRVEDGLMSGLHAGDALVCQMETQDTPITFTVSRMQGMQHELVARCRPAGSPKNTEHFWTLRLTGILFK